MLAPLRVGAVIPASIMPVVLAAVVSSATCNCFANRATPQKLVTGGEPGTSNEKPNWCIAAMAEGQPKTETVDPLVRLGAP
jgi:hypothetical protein